MEGGAQIMKFLVEKKLQEPENDGETIRVYRRTPLILNLIGTLRKLGERCQSS